MVINTADLLLNSWTPIILRRKLKVSEKMNKSATAQPRNQYAAAKIGQTDL
jgi:hypothetical protein